MSSRKSSGKSPPRAGQAPWAELISLGVIVLAGSIYLPIFENNLDPLLVLGIYDVCVLSAAVTSAVLATRLWRSFERGETMSMIWGGMSVGLIAWAVGEAIWSSDQLWGGNSLPYPSLADLLWIFGYIPIIWALSIRLQTLRIRPNRPWQLVLLISTGISFLLISSLIMVPIITDTSTSRVFEKTVNLIYPGGDLILALLTMTLVTLLVGGTLFNSWGFIASGFLCAASSDLLYAWTIWKGTFQVNPASGMDLPSFISNILYVAFYVLVALGLYRQYRLAGSFQPH